MEFLHSFLTWKTLKTLVATSNTPFDFHIFIHYLQVDNLSNKSTTKPTEENQANTEEEGNGTKKCKLSAQ